MGEAPARVVFATEFSRRYTGGVTEFAVADGDIIGSAMVREARGVPALPL